LRKWLIGLCVLSTLLFGVGAKEIVHKSVVRIEIEKTNAEFKVVYESLSATIQESSETASAIEGEVSEIEMSNSEVEVKLATGDYLSKEDKVKSALNFEDLTQVTGFTPEEFDMMLVGKPLEGYGYIFSDAEKNHQVNGLFLIALTGLEQGYGSADTGLKVKKNLTSYGAYDGATYRAWTFESYWECIDTTSRALHKSYLTPGGSYYNGLSVRDVNIKYASDDEWAYKIESIMLGLVKKLN